MLYIVVGLDNSTRGVRRVLLQRRMQVSAKCTHERDQSRHSANPSAPHDPHVGTEALLCPHQAYTHLCAVLLRRFQRGLKEIQEDGCQKLWLSLVLSILFCDLYCLCAFSDKNMLDKIYFIIFIESCFFI